MSDQFGISLAYRTYGAGTPLIIVHGLFGSGENWQRVAEILADRFRVIVPDLRNHGESPHVPFMDIDAMAGDVRQMCAELGLDSAHFLGHSLGAKVILRIADRWPDLADRLILVDMTAERSEPRHVALIEALLAIPSGIYRKRSEVDAALAKTISSAPVRAFLLKGMKRDDSGALHWRMNIAAIAENYRNLGEAVDVSPQPDREALLLYGGRSDYVTPPRIDAMRALFARLRTREFPHAGHWLHADVRDEFLAAVRGFLPDPAA
jgi:pimeloyl-ACP methyl ester carboxylesterase